MLDWIIASCLFLTSPGVLQVHDGTGTCYEADFASEGMSMYEAGADWCEQFDPDGTGAWNGMYWTGTEQNAGALQCPSGYMCIGCEW